MYARGKSRDLHLIRFQNCSSATSHRAQNSLQPHCTLTSTSSSHQVANSNSDDVMRTSLYHPRRAVMYVPTSKQNKVIKTTTLSVDSIVFDIEDGVASNQKVRLRGPDVGGGGGRGVRGQSIQLSLILKMV